MPDIKLRDGSGVEQTYTGVDTITVPLADGSGNFTYGYTGKELKFKFDEFNFVESIPKVVLIRNKEQLDIYGISSFAYDTNWESFEPNLYDDFTLNFGGSNSSRGVLENAFSGYPYDSIPNIIFKGNVQNASNYGPFNLLSCFYGCKKIRQIPENLFDYVTDNSGDSIFNTKMGQIGNMFKGCSSLRKMPNFIKRFNTTIDNNVYNSYSYMPYYYLFDSCYVLDEIVDLPIWDYETKDFPTNNCFYNNYLCRIKNFTFDNSVKKKARWNYQIINLQDSGYDASGNKKQYFLDQGMLEKDNVFQYNDRPSSSTSLDDYITKYNVVKNSDGWFSSASGSLTYEGNSNIPFSRLFSRYNHDSMVATINSLPDTSEYIAEKGGTNTIKFSKCQGDLTDGGGASDLTEEEIAVATAKGWTIALV